MLNSAASCRSGSTVPPMHTTFRRCAAPSEARVPLVGWSVGRAAVGTEVCQRRPYDRIVGPLFGSPEGGGYLGRGGASSTLSNIGSFLGQSSGRSSQTSDPLSNPARSWVMVF